MLSFFLKLLFKFLFFTPTVFLSNIVSDLLRSNFFILLVVSEKISWAFLFLSFFFFLSYYETKKPTGKCLILCLLAILDKNCFLSIVLSLTSVHVSCLHYAFACESKSKSITMKLFFFFFSGGQIRHFNEIECQPPVLKSSDMLNNYKTPCHGFLMQTFTLSLCPSMSLHICLTQAKLVDLGTSQLNLYLPTAIRHGVTKSRTQLSD